MRTVRFTGGMNLVRQNGKRGANASWPLAELALDGEHGVVRLRQPLRALLGRELRVAGLDFALPTVRFDVRDAAVSPYRGLLSRGVLIVPGNGRSVVFWTRDPERVLAALKQARARVDA